MNRGYVKLWRKTLDNGMMQNPRLMLFWVWCLLKASHKVHETMVGFRKVTLQKGQFVFGLKAASKETKLGVQTIRTCLEALKSTHQVTYQPTHSFSIVTICNWELYQTQEIQGNTPSNTQSNTPVTDLQQTSNTPVTTNKNGNNGENGENDKNTHTPAEFIDLHKTEYIEWVHQHGLDPVADRAAIEIEYGATSENKKAQYGAKALKYAIADVAKTTHMERSKKPVYEKAKEGETHEEREARILRNLKSGAK